MIRGHDIQIADIHRDLLLWLLLLHLHLLIGLLGLLLLLLLGLFAVLSPIQFEGFLRIRQGGPIVILQNLARGLTGLEL